MISVLKSILDYTLLVLVQMKLQLLSFELCLQKGYLVLVLILQLSHLLLLVIVIHVTKYWWHA